ncbi:single-stranded DNA-binding protein [Prevotella sp.]
MKKEYQMPSTLIVSVETEGEFLKNSFHGTEHEGFTEVQDPNLVVDDATDEDSPF